MCAVTLTYLATELLLVSLVRVPVIVHSPTHKVHFCFLPIFVFVLGRA